MSMANRKLQAEIGPSTSRSHCLSGSATHSLEPLVFFSLVAPVAIVLIALWNSGVALDRVMKSISEGLGKFKEIWEKAQEAGTQNLKDKYEGELKKEIKKLQKLRDQLKSWASSSDVKNKQPLLDARKSIEVEMERFKVLERESKTKAYSKEGLAQIKKKKKSGPVIERNKSTYKWIEEKVEMLEQQITDFTELSDEASEAKKEEYQMWIERHNYHLKELDKTKDRLENSDLTKEQVEELVDEIDFYCESNQDADFFYDEQLYAVLDEYCQERQVCL